jgi:hypothetical protein
MRPKDEILLTMRTRRPGLRGPWLWHVSYTISSRAFTETF